MATVLDGWEAPPLALHLVTPAGTPRPVRVAVLLEFLTARFTSGAVPWVGDALDVAFRANRRNMRLLRDYFDRA